MRRSGADFLFDELHEDDFLFDAAAPQLDADRSPGHGAPPGHLGLLAALVLHEGDKRLLVRSSRSPLPLASGGRQQVGGGRALPGVDRVLVWS